MRKKSPAKQLGLIVDNVRGPVNREYGLFQSVMTAWTDGMTQMEGLASGISQRTHTGGVLLALPAWHLYPDMMAVVPCVTRVRQNDPMFASGGVMTVGLGATPFGSEWCVLVSATCPSPTLWRISRLVTLPQ